MKALNTYLMFNGNCQEAMTFYQRCLGGELNVMRYSDGPMQVPSGAEDKVMHANLQRDSAPILMASDAMHGQPVKEGNNFSISIACDSEAELDKLFGALGEKGTVTLERQNMFWGAYFGMLTDQFGVNWMFSFDKPKTA